MANLRRPSGNLEYPTCSVEHCVNHVRSAGSVFCEKHYMRNRRHGDPHGGFTRDSSVPYQEWFWQQVEKTDACWLWSRGRDSCGYGTLMREDGSADRAHRMAWILTFGEIADGLFVCHKCDNPPCCRPDHLFLGSQKDNMQDAARKNRTVFGEQHSTQFTEKDVVEMRLARSSGLSYAAIGYQFSCSPGTVRNIVTGIQWRRSGGPISKINSDGRGKLRFLKCDGETHCLAEWSRITGIDPTTIAQRIKAGWSVGDAIRTQPLTFQEAGRRRISKSAVGGTEADSPARL